LENRISSLNHFVEVVANEFRSPVYCISDEGSCFRFQSPANAHFCILKLARAVSGLNASMVLARNGFAQELCVLVRTIIECTTLIDWVLGAVDGTDDYQNAVQSHVASFFADHDRVAGVHTPANLKQERIHKEVGATLDRFLSDSGIEIGRPAKELFSKTYLTYSYYVHARYPECMDMYGGSPSKLHVRGMLQTPKDGENLDILDTFARSVELSALHIMVRLALRSAVANHPHLRQWLDDFDKSR